VGSAETASDTIERDATVTVSGFTSGGYPKADPSIAAMVDFGEVAT
jgi:hypothetical protein